jgi:ppGpp synthetase/RelA/SpoT-type nucleotidyltranferase
MMRAMTRHLSTAQVDRLGERLRASEHISEADLISLQSYRAEHEEALVEVQTRIERALPGIDQTARIKTIQTLHDKLRRQPTKLSRVQDIAGVRIVQDMDLNGQDAMVRDLTTEFSGARVIDRRVEPSFGYRAAHVVVRVGRCACEIQVRTSQQHLWAEIVERLADRWGRQIRYGGQPDEPGKETGNSTRREFWAAVLTVSDVVHGLEEVAADQNFAADAGAAPEGFNRVELNQARLSMRAAMADLMESLDRGVAL